MFQPRMIPGLIGAYAGLDSGDLRSAIPFPDRLKISLTTVGTLDAAHRSTQAVRDL